MRLQGNNQQTKIGGTFHMTNFQDCHITGREAAVLGLLCQGKGNKTIAYELGLSEGTVKVHLRNVMRKLRAKNRTEVAVWALHRQRSTLQVIGFPA